MAACLLGIAAWIGVTVLAGALADDPTDPEPTLIAFAAGGTAFFGAIFGYSLWRTRRRAEPELDALLSATRLPAEPQAAPHGHAAEPAIAARDRVIASSGSVVLRDDHRAGRAAGPARRRPGRSRSGRSRSTG